MSSPRRPESYAGIIRSDAIDRWGHYRENTYHLFKVNTRTITTLLIFGIGIPGALYYYTSKIQAKHEQMVADKIAKAAANKN
ncbi:hypothetical protein TrispH2_003715 [Trichoplax sp. H2]|nr:hypothetical protein TrispH2_003715 [Trichoplax sp. H2]|eukprot:RDD44573.1 hypothetical protein TrispH2_003715 [Trichoplax sp. H2]